jgi:transposase-like protein
MERSEMAQWRNTLSRRRRDGTPSASSRAREEAVLRLTPVVFEDAEALALVKDAARRDPDHRIRSTALSALRREAVNRLSSSVHEVRLKTIARLPDVLGWSWGHRQA